MILGLAGIAAVAQDSAPGGAAKTSVTIEERMDKLEAGQQRLLKELADLRRLLEAKSDLAARKAVPSKASVRPLDVHGEPFRGQSEARVAIIEYSDFACPYCAEYARKTYPRIEADYIKPGRVKYFFRDLPEPGHTNALAAAQAVRCAGEQGKFWEMHDLVFAAQPALNGPDLETYAQAVGLDAEKFKACLSSDRWAEPIRRSAAGARQMEIYGTPAFLIGTISEDGNVVQVTRTVVGGTSFDALKLALDEVLSGRTQSLVSQTTQASR